MKCEKCNSPIDDNDKFCSKCGKKLDNENNIQKTVSRALNNTNELVSVFPAVSIFFENKKNKEISIIVAENCGAGFTTLTLKIFMYAGYFIREAETKILNKKIGNISDDKIKSIISSGDSKSNKIKGVANYLDETEILGLSEKTKKYVFFELEKLEIVMNKVLENLQKNSALMMSMAFIDDAEEILMRNFYYGYCLGVACEIIE